MERRESNVEAAERKRKTLVSKEESKWSCCLNWVLCPRAPSFLFKQLVHYNTIL